MSFFGDLWRLTSMPGWNEYAHCGKWDRFLWGKGFPTEIKGQAITKLSKLTVNFVSEKD